MTEQDDIWRVLESHQTIDLSIFINGEISNEKLLLIINKKSGLASYSHEFMQGFQNPQILSGFISAISRIISEMTEMDESQWKTISGADSNILVENGEWSIGVLVATKVTSEIRSKLRSTIRVFEEHFQFLQDIECVQDLFSDFDSYVRSVFVDDRVTGRTMVSKVRDWRIQLLTIEPSLISSDIEMILSGFSDSMSVEEIVRSKNLSFDRVVESVSAAFWYGLVRLTFIPLDSDILDLSEKASSILFKKTNPLNLSTYCLRTVARFNGRTPLGHFLQVTREQDERSLLVHLGSLISRGLVQRISQEKRAVLYHECILSNLVSRGASILGSQTMMQIFEIVHAGCVFIHPHIRRIVLSDKMELKCVLEENMTLDDLDDIRDTLEYFIHELVRHFTIRYSTRIVDDLLMQTSEDCMATWNLNNLDTAESLR
jgi:hypothetical protein